MIACAAFALLLVPYTWRIVGYWPQALAGARNPSRAFGYFSLVAATNVVAVRLALAHHSPVTLVLGAASVPLWLILTYTIPGAMFELAPRSSVDLVCLTNSPDDCKLSRTSPSRPSVPNARSSGRQYRA